jgi:hypothetical protein
MKKLKIILSHIRAAAEYRSIPQQLVDIVLHRLIINFTPGDYYRFEFYKPGKSWEEKGRYVSLDGSRYFPFENNEFKYSATLSNKYIQKHLLMGLGLPTPRLIATLGHGLAIQREQEFYAFLEKLDQDIVLKPIRSAGGSGIRVISMKDGQLYSANLPCTRESVWRELSGRMDRGYLIEERVKNTGVLVSLNPGCLNTFRVVTIKTKDGLWHCASVSIKIGAQGAIADNNVQGGIQITLDTQGRPYHAYDFTTSAPLTFYRDTGINLMELEFDGFSSVVELALTASQKFNYLGTIGWDIAYTETGPMIIEGNIVWGCTSPQRGRPGIITNELARGLDRHYAFGRWDRSRFYPGYHRKGLLRRLLS